MIELANKQVASVLDCVAAAPLEVGQCLRLTGNGPDALMSAVPLVNAADTVGWGLRIAHWINERSTTTTYTGGAAGLTFPLTAAADADAQHFIPTGADMVAVGGKVGVEIRFYIDSLSQAFGGVLPAVGDVLGVSNLDSKLCPTGHASVIANLTQVARVVAADPRSVTVILA